MAATIWPQVNVRKRTPKTGKNPKRANTIVLLFLISQGAPKGRQQKGETGPGKQGLDGQGCSGDFYRRFVKLVFNFQGRVNHEVHIVNWNTGILEAENA